MPVKPTLYFSYEFEGHIWKLCVDRFGPSLAAEIRDQENREVYFVCINSTDLSQQAFFPETGEDWWVGMEAIVDKIILLHRFKDEEDPEHMGIIGMDADTGTLLWEQSEMQLYEPGKNGLLAFRNDQEERQFVRLDSRKGTILEDSIDVNKVQKELAAGSNEGVKDCFYPSHYPAGTEYFNTVKEFLYDETGYEPVKAMDYMEYEGYVIISYYIYEQEQLANYLLLMDEDANVFEHLCIGRNLGGIGMDTFFVYRHLLVFVKDKKELLGYALQN